MITYLKTNWKFIKEDITNAHLEDFDDSAFRIVTVPHDYAIEGPFSPENDKQVSEVVADGVAETVHIGRTGGLPICDHAWYRRKFMVNENTKNVFIEFDGVMCNSEVFVNGIKCGGRIYGYSSFSIDITKVVKFGEENTLAVVTRPEDTASRYYTGAGIYRNVRLVEKDEVFFPYLPVFVRPSIKENKAVVAFDIQVENSQKEFELEISIFDKEKQLVASKSITSQRIIGRKTSASEILNDKIIISENSSNKMRGKQTTISDVLTFEDFKRWEVLNAYLYTFEVKLLVSGKEMDTYSTKFGIRTLRFDANEGLFINEQYTKLQGVCMHHDLGPLGAAINVSAIRRQIEKLIAIGVNAIRFTHNPPAPEYIDLCDEYGILSIDEAFDEWKIKKVKNGYGKYFDQCAEDDIVTMLRRDRNHPSIIMWSIGNEILEQNKPWGWKYAKYLSGLCHREDVTRPTTAGFSMAEASFEWGLCAEVDIVGVNYKPHQYERFHRMYPEAVLYGSETSSCISSRGHYYLPRKFPYEAITRDDLQMCSYELESPPWAYYPERELFAQKKYDYLLGEFVWTGFDYIGEPTPYREEWPSRSSYFGIYDLAGIEKDRVYSYKAIWKKEEVLHLFPHWNWNEGDVVDVHCYSSFDQVELFLNGNSLGICEKIPSDDLRFHRLIWKDIPFEKGEIKAVAVEKPTVVDCRKTADVPYKIVVTPEKPDVVANNEDLAFILCEIYDKNGILCPNADNSLNFEVIGGEYVASDAGDATSLRMFTEEYCHVFHGKCIVMVKASEVGEIKVKAMAEGLILGEASVFAK